MYDPTPQLPALTTQETALIRQDYPSIEHLESGNIVPWLLERQDQLLVRAKDERTGMNLAKLITLTSGAIGAVCYATGPLAVIGAILSGVGYAWSVAQDLNDSHQFAPIPFIRGNFIDFIQAMGDYEARQEWFANQDEIVDLMFHLSPFERYEFGMLRGHTPLVAELLSRTEPGKRFYAYRFLLDWFINLRGDFPSQQDLTAHLGAVTKDPRINYGQVEQLQQYQNYVNSLRHTQLPTPPSTQLLEAQVVSEQPAQDKTSLEQWLAEAGETNSISDTSKITHSNPAIARIAQVCYDTFKTHRAPCNFIDGIDGFKFFRLTWRSEPSTTIKRVMDLSDNLFADLGAILPEIEKAPLISQVRGGLLAVDVAKPKSDWRIAYFRDYVTPASYGCEVPVSLPIGVDMDGRMIKVCLSDHNTRSLLIGGSPGGGKSNWATSSVCSIICQYTPESVQLVLSDVQQVEFEAFRNIPHLFAPLANTISETVDVLRSAEIEMDRRQNLFVAVGAKNIDEYNAKVSKDKQVPRLIIFVEEIADIVISQETYTEETESGRTVQKSYADEFNRLQQRFNQVGRKWGVSLNSSTQSPRREIIPPHIRTLYPAFLAFMVTRPEESKIILGGQDEGATALLGYGDAIIMTNVARDRVQTLLVEPHEVSAIVNRVIGLYGSFQPRFPRDLEKNDLQESTTWIESSTKLQSDSDRPMRPVRQAPIAPPRQPDSPIPPSPPSPIGKTPESDPDWDNFCTIREGRAGREVGDKIIRKSKSQLCQELFGLPKNPGGNARNAAFAEYDRIRDRFMLDWIRDLIRQSASKREIIEQIWSISRLKQSRFRKEKPDEWAHIRGLIDSVASEMEYEFDENTESESAAGNESTNEIESNEED